MVKLKKVLIILVIASSLLALTVFIGLDIVIKQQTQLQLYNDIDSLPKHKVGLLLGTAKYTTNPKGGINLYYKYRIQAAVELYQAQKIDYILASGDNSKYNYNEPIEMQNDLVKAGIPRDKIYLDYAGFRTLDSVVRSQRVFGQDSITIISQPFHNQRALFIAKYKGIDAVGYNAKAVQGSYSWRTKIREKFARIKMLGDLIFNKQPKFLGDPIPIGF